MVSTAVACALPSGRVVHSDSSGEGKGMSIHKWGVFVNSDARAPMQQFQQVDDNQLVTPIHAH